MSPEHTSQVLATAGYKLTKPRRQIIAWIDRHTGIFSATELHTAMPQLDKVSVYRVLDLLTKLDIIHLVGSMHREKHYERHQSRQHHHHLVCTTCEKSLCVPCTLEDKNFVGFDNIHHSILLTGLCQTCTA